MADNIVVICSRCKKSFPSLYGSDHQADGCATTLVLTNSVSTNTPKEKSEKTNELLPFWVSIANDAHVNHQLAPGYGSDHDFCTFAFIDPVSGRELTKDDIVKQHSWIQNITNICDSCINNMVENKELLKTNDPFSDDNMEFENDENDENHENIENK